MKTFISTIKWLVELQVNFIKSYFDWRIYSSVIFFLVISIFLEYNFDFYDTHLRTLIGKPERFLGMFIFQIVPFLVVCFIVSIFTKKRSWLRSRKFWFKVILGFSIQAMDRSFFFHYRLIDHLDPNDYKYLRKVLNELDGFVLLVIPMVIMYLLIERGWFKSFYGIRVKYSNMKPYYIMLAGMVVIVGLGSFFGDLQAYYPRYQFTGGTVFAQRHGLSEWITIALYELPYGADFFSIELFFRGFLVLAFSRWLGGHVALATATAYVFLHFGKPLTETISSFFGGYILGVLAYSTRNIWGGVFIHAGTAWLMEIFGFIQMK